MRLRPGSPRWGVAAVAAVVLASVAPGLGGFLRAPAGWSFTGATAYADDLAQHELWARQMARHGRFLVNLMTPEDTARGWFFNPLELLLGLLMRGTSAPYQVVSVLVTIAAIPALAWGLLALARRAALPRPAISVTAALLLGSLAPLGLVTGKLGLPGDNPIWISYGGAATPIFAGTWLQLTLATLPLVALLHADVVRGFRRAGAMLFVLGAVYPFFVPALLLTGAVYGVVVGRAYGWRRTLTGLVWFVALALPPLIYYGVLLPHVDPEFARFSRLNHQSIPTLPNAVVSLGVGLGALVGLRRLVRGNRAQQLLGCFALSLVVMLFAPYHPWRSHLLSLSPLLVLAALSAWWPVVRRLDRGRRYVVVAAVLLAAFPSTPYYYVRNLRGMNTVEPPQYLSSGTVTAIRWLARQPGDGVVLARSDISPWIAARSGHRVLVGHYLWTHDWSERRDEVDAVFRGTSPRRLLESFDVDWVLVDTDRGVPAWAAAVKPVARFGATTILRSADVQAAA